MRRTIILALAVVLALGLASFVWITFDVPPLREWFRSEETPPAPVPKTANTEPSPTGLVAEELRARRASGREFLAAARSLIGEGVLTEARDLIRRGFRMDPDSEDLVAAFESIRGLRDEARLPTTDVIQGWRNQAFRRSWPPLVALYRRFGEDGLEAERERIVQLFLEVLPVHPVKSELSLVWFEPWSRWMLPDQVMKLRVGFELIDGEWVPPGEMDVENELHRTWLNPWVLSDGVHVVSAPVDYRVAKEILEYTGAFRRFFLETYRDDLLLRKPGVQLPVWICRNQREFQDRIRRWYQSQFPGQFIQPRVRHTASAGAVYLLVSEEIESPCILPLMSEDEERPAWEFWPVLRHQLTHQLVATHLFHERPIPSRGRHQGLSDSIAEHAEHHNLDENGWRFNRTEFAKTLERCREELDTLPSLEDVVMRDILRLRWRSNDELGIRRMLACLAAFCLLGDDPDHRLAYLALLETAEMNRLTRQRFRACLTYRQLVKLSKDWYAFMGSGEGLPGEGRE